MSSAVFVAHLPAEREPVEHGGALASALELLVARCRATFPEISLDAAAFVAHVAARLPQDISPEQWLGEVNAEDSYLACACLHGDRAAIDELDRRFSAEIEPMLRRSYRDDLDDAKQILRQRLLLPTGATEPKLATYSGRGPLRRWLRVVVHRLVLEIIRPRQSFADDWAIAALPMTGDDPEHAYLKTHYRDAYERAFERALAQMSARERTVLAQYHIDGLTVDDLGALYQIHRATASRWVAKMRAHLRALVIEDLRAGLGLSTAGLESVARLVHSQLAGALVRAFAAA